MRKNLLLLFACAMFNTASFAQGIGNPGSNHGNRFEQLGTMLPTPNEYRNASGAPGPKYWQQRADYDINVELDEPNNKITGSELITYYNNSPDVLTYLWIEMDENFHHPKSDNVSDGQSSLSDRMTDRQLEGLDQRKYLEGYGMNVTRVVDGSNKALKYTINQTMMRIDMPVALKPGQKISFRIDWNYKVPDKLTRGGRGGYEVFEEGNNLYSISQWYPRLAVYSDFQGWNNQQFHGGSEFSCTFGNYKVKMTVPADHIIASTGMCTNLKSVLTAAQYKRWEEAQNAKDVVEVVTLAEAKENMKDKSTDKKTWNFEAENVRDFAWNSSRRLVWDAMPTNIEGKKVMSMSYYGPEAYPLYRKYSTKVVAHTLKVYSKHTIPYPYPQATSVEAAIGMEYPMLAMNFGRAEKDGTYSEATKYGAIGVIIHEVGHNFFPMIVNSDERQWWWMDEGLNTFTQFLTEQEFDNNYPSRRGPAHMITDYMKGPKNGLEPIMTMGDAVANVGSNAYAKAATGMNILRETVMGRELFDFSYREYARRWAFKHPTPADLFRTMEDASAVDLDWFWRGWWFGTEAVDISLDSVKYYRMDDPKNAVALKQVPFDAVSKQRNAQDKSIIYAVDADTSLRDFYYQNPGADQKMREDQAARMIQKDSANAAKWVDKHFYELTFSNQGGMVMPIVVEWTFKDGTKEVDRIPVTIWRGNEKMVKKAFAKGKEVATVKLDPYRETADIDESNGLWPVKEMPSKFQLFRMQGGQGPRGQAAGGNAMQRRN